MPYVVTDAPFGADRCVSALGPQVQPTPAHVSPTRSPGRSGRRWSGTVYGVDSGRSSSKSIVLPAFFPLATIWSGYARELQTCRSTSSGIIWRKR